MKILWITGEGDFSAMEFEEAIGEEKAIAMIGNKIDEDVELSEGIYGRIIEFGEIDKKFISFIRNKVQDYDSAKQQNFYEID